MPRQRQVEENEATRTAIKAIARQLMETHGTAGLSLRAIARAMNITAPALYHYFASLDDLITALLVDAFEAHADYVRAAIEQAAEEGATYARQLLVALLAYRTWAIENAMEYQLIYGNPIPGYAAPKDVTVPAASRIAYVVMDVLMAGVEAGEFAGAGDAASIPPTVRAHYVEKFELAPEVVPLFHLMNQGRSLIHGLVALEIYHHNGPVVGDAAAFYAQTVREYLQALGIPIAP